MKNIAYQLQQILEESQKGNKISIPVNETGEVDFYFLPQILEELRIKSSEIKIPTLMSKIDLYINKVIDNYLLLTHREKVGTRISEDIAWLLVGFGFNMATYSLRLTEQAYFTHGLVALGMASKVLELRDIIKLFALYWDVAKKKDLSFQSVLDLKDDFSDVLQGFLARDEVDKSLECMGFVLIGEGNSIQYKTI